MRILFFAGLTALAAGCTAESSTPALASQATDPSGSHPAVEAPTDVSPASPDAVETPSAAQGASGLYALEAQTLEGEAIDLGEFSGQVTLIVNVASRCGYTGQYAGLQELHAELAEHGFSVLAFPSNEFGGQEPGSPAEIREFCTSRYDVAFPMFAKCEVKGGEGQSPVYAFLEQESGEVPGWNFCKYLIGKDGQVIAFFKSNVAPDAEELRIAIEEALG